ncbi:uncharacterized protein LOC129952226 [Eupeodes corollae]|uniref:uncharacterized protein LOC129952226 n=1 Tax=Eupeodes corollae TaxID=290404 RepID=UPI0024901DF7|nr:uncharacterized protein LOC129952226 [Eupeodes corollae]
MPLLQNTVLGWVVAGKIENVAYNNATCAIFCEDDSTNDLIERFWKLDDFEDSPRSMTTAEKFCETHFTQTVTRSNTGRFEVRLPFRENGEALGDSKQLALNRFMSLERRLNKNPTLRRDYIKFMDEYEAFGHMEQINPTDIPKPHFFIPHHCVLKPDSSTTKLRVVFDASAKTSTGLSLNDILHTGPTVQSELFSILLRFRMHKYVFTADIEKMYRQILVHEEDQNYQLIVWRQQPSEGIKYYKLKTVSYGTSAAPYLATKCLQFLASQSKLTHPIGSQILLEDFYVDDCISGSNSITQTKEAQKQLRSILDNAGFKLRKWCANHPQLLNDIRLEDQEICLDFTDASHCTIKTLGLVWQPKSDELCGRAKINDTSSITKRVVSSELARIFNPLGLFGPVVVQAKIFMQKLWHSKLSWDDELPQHLKEEWFSFRKDIADLDQAKIPRHVSKGNPTSIQIHTFVDASERAYGAAVYLRSTYQDRTIINRLLCAKSRVAPIKQQTLPRLELCAAVLGAELTRRVREDVRLPEAAVFFWTDSQIVLSWINSTSSSYHTFVANRIAKIQEHSWGALWRHVPSKENPADLLSRGISARNFMSCHMWLYGPFFLHGNESAWPQTSPREQEPHSDLERKRKNIVAIALQDDPPSQFIYKIQHRNSFKFLQNTIGYMLPFIKRAKKLKVNPEGQKALSPKELNESLMTIIRQIQSIEFKGEIQDLKRNKGLCKSSAFITLAPFLDDNNVLRVGGRLEAASISFDAKHPILLPYNESITKLLFKFKHDSHNHCGPQTLLSILRQQFWPIKGKITARHTVHNCIRCTRTRPNLMTQIMGNLPADRVTPNRPFLISGVDFCGPLWVHFKIRGKKPHKVYLAVFCCFSTKAVHLEIVTDLTTEAFIGAVRRFISRRGRIQTLYCDNATNFVGAKNQLAELKDILHTTEARESIIKASSDKGITFKFIPPRAPHFGGLWEAAVKSAKHLLLRTVSTASLTHEELETVVIEIEAILNSRPLTPLSETKILRNRWSTICYLKHEFWKRWSTEYLNQLQQRNRWNTSQQNIRIGDLVIIKEDNIPTLKWPLGRIVDIFKGQDDIVRVVNVKTQSGILKRPIHRLAPLLDDSEDVNQEQEDEDTQAETSPKRRKTCNTSLITTVILSLFLLPMVIASPINITRFKNNPGLYFENLGSANLIANEWNLVTYYDLAPIRAELEAFNNGTKALQHVCNQLQLRTTCNAMVTYLTNMKISLQGDTNLISRHRSTRAAIYVVGNIAHTLFGLLDSDYAEELSKTIDHINNNEPLLLSMLKNQTSVIDSTINIIKHDQLEVRNRINMLQNQANEIIGRIGNTTDQLRVFQIFTTLAMQLMMMASNLQRIEGTILKTLTDVHYGNINPLLLSPTQLKAEIMNIKNHLPLSQKLPFEQEDLLQFYKISTTKGGSARKHLIFFR